MLDFIYYPVSWILWFWHRAFGYVFGMNSGVAWGLAVVFLMPLSGRLVGKVPRSKIEDTFAWVLDDCELDIQPMQRSAVPVDAVAVAAQPATAVVASGMQAPGGLNPVARVTHNRLASGEVGAELRCQCRSHEQEQGGRDPEPARLPADALRQPGPEPVRLFGRLLAGLHHLGAPRPEGAAAEQCERRGQEGHRRQERGHDADRGNRGHHARWPNRRPPRGK